MNCPTRRAGLIIKGNFITYPNATKPDATCKSDYAANGGSVFTNPFTPNGPFWTSFSSLYSGPIDYAEGLSSRAVQNFEDKQNASNGLFHVGSRVGLHMITDGQSKTMLIGEKQLKQQAYFGDATDPGDVAAAYCGDNEDNKRWTHLLPLPDTENTRWRFGSAHSSGLNAAMADGSVRFINFDIAAQPWRVLGSRNDGEVSN